jgi:hypothetical protein
VGGAREPARLKWQDARLARLSPQQDAIVTTRGTVTLVKGDRAWHLNDREAQKLVEVLTTGR